jgi:hypothetical protein
VAFAPLGPWTRGDVLDLHIFILLLIWFTMDRCNLYVADWIVKDRLNKLLFNIAMWFKIRK